MAKALINYYLAQSCKYKANLKLMHKSMSEAAIHDFRVSIKRLRTVHELLQELNPELVDAASQSAAFRDVFKISGKLRDIQVQIDILEELSLHNHKFYTHFYAYLKKKESIATANLYDFLYGKDYPVDFSDYHESAEKLVQDIDENNLLSTINQIVHNLMLHSFNLFNQENKEEALHEIRTNVKRCHYLLTIAQYLTSDTPEVITKKIEIVNKAGDLLGNWHDLDVTVRTLHSFQPSISTIPYYRNKYNSLAIILKQKRRHSLKQTISFLQFMFQVFIDHLNSSY